MAAEYSNVACFVDSLTPPRPLEHASYVGWYSNLLVGVPKVSDKQIPVNDAQSIIHLLQQLKVCHFVPVNFSNPSRNFFLFNADLF